MDCTTVHKPLPRSSRVHTVTRAAASNLAGNDKVLHLMRHGTTEMNVYLTRNEYGSRDFRDPLLYDTVLTPKGHEGARRAAAGASRLSPAPELLVVSPLTRALQTATAAFGSTPPCPVLVEPLIRERLYLSSDIGSHPEHLAQNWPQFEFDHLPPIWWHHDGSDDELAVVPEPEAVFQQRMAKVRDWLATRPERSIAIVSHWGCLHSMTGHHFDNCELRTVQMSQLLL